MQIIRVRDEVQLKIIRGLFKEYAAGLGFDLSFQNFESELDCLPGVYSEPDGMLILVYSDGMAAGCASLKKLAEGICEMKRLFVRPEFRGKGLGRLLALTIISEARMRGYKKIRLDTIDTMTEAISMYTGMGFHTIAPYYHNPVAGAIFMEMDL